MSGNQCFDGPIPVLSAKQYSDNQRRVTIYGNVAANYFTTGTANPKKQNQYTYNNNISLRGKCLEAARSYELLQDYVAGDAIANPVLVSTPKYESWSGNLYTVDYKANGINVPVQADASWNDVVVDPSYQIFYNQCEFNYPNENRPAEWTAIVDLSFQTTYYAQRANNELLDLSCNLCACP